LTADLPWVSLSRLAATGKFRLESLTYLKPRHDLSASDVDFRLALRDAESRWGSLFRDMGDEWILAGQQFGDPGQFCWP
jgi:hypothetical protein